MKKCIHFSISQSFSYRSKAILTVEMLLSFKRSILIALILSFGVVANGFVLQPRKYLSHIKIQGRKIVIRNHNEEVSVPTEEITSTDIRRLQKKCEELELAISEVGKSITDEQVQLTKLNEEYGDEITRVKKEFNRIKERSYEESRELSKMAKIDAVKLVLPITDNYFRAKQVFEPLQSDGDKTIMSVYDNIFNNFSQVLEEFGATRVVSLGQPFDFNMMEAIMTAPSTEYNKDIVVTEYQVGYRMEDRCIRPAMVVVSSGPGPSSS